MKRAFKVLLAASAGLAFLLALAPEIWSALANDNDPRARIGAWQLVYHTHRGQQQLVVRTPSDQLFKVNYGIVSVICTVYAVLWLIITVAISVVRKQQLLSASRNRANCLFCGYDLRATPNRCPECGRKASAEFLSQTPPAS